MRIVKTRVCALILLLLLVLSEGALYASAAEPETIKVGFFYQAGYHEIDENGAKDGYGYALMQYIRRYADMNFEYVGYDKSWADMLKMLETGEIDVLTDVAMTPQRQEKFLFSDVPVGSCDVILSVKAGNTELVQGEYATYNGRKIGFLGGVAENQVFASFARENNFWYRGVYYPDTNELSEALHSGEVDAIVSTDFRSVHDEWILERMSASDVYLVVDDDNPELMEKFNDALKRLDSNEVGWRSKLKATYYPYSATTEIYFTLHEQEIIARFREGGEVLKVTAMPDNAPYSWYEKDENGTTVARGVHNLFFRQIADKLGIRYQYVIPRSFSEYEALISSDLVDLVIDMPEDYYGAEEKGFVQSARYDDVSLARIYTRRFSGEAKTVACLINSPYLHAKVKELHPDAKIVTYESMEAAVEGVERGWVDFLYCLDHTAQIIVNQDYKAQLRYAVVGSDKYGFAMGVRDDEDHSVATVITKVILHSGDRILYDIYNENINLGVSEVPGLVAIVYNNPIPVLILGSVVLMIICFLVTGFVLARRREREVVLRKDLENSALLRAMYTAMPFGLLRLEITGDEYRITYANRHFFEMMGAADLEEANALYDRGVGRGILDGDRYDVRTMYDRLQLVGDSTTAESRAKAPGGGICWLRCNSTLVDIVGKTRVVQQLILDITEEREVQERKERRNTEEAINRMFGTITRNSSDIYVLYSLDKQKTRFVSPNTEQQLGVSLEEAYRDVDVFRRIEIEGEIVRPMDKLDAIEKGDAYLGEVKRVHMQTGEIRWYRDEAYMTTIGDERHLIVVMTDITQDRSRHEALQMALKNAENASSAKTTFLSNMSHDIRTPMNTIVGLTNLLKTDALDSDKAARHLDHLEIAANNMMEILNNVLDMSRIENGGTLLNEAPFSLMDLLRDVDAISATQARVKGLHVRTSNNLEEEWYIGDSLRLKQVLLNLVSNAVKYTNEGGTIDLSASTQNYVGQDRRMIRFVIRDTGIGMSEEFQRELFTPFTRERNSTTSGIVGTGLGMAIVKNMVDLMGGWIQVSSTVGVGTTFTVDIPLRSVEEMPGQESNGADLSEMNISGLRILVAEDNDLNAEILIELLDREGAICQRAENGQRAVEMFLSSPENTFDVILMDIQMPVMNGLEAVRAIRASDHPEARTISISAMTANAFTEDIENALAAGMDAHIPKPVDMTILKETILGLRKGR